MKEKDIANRLERAAVLLTEAAQRVRDGDLDSALTLQVQAEQLARRARRAKVTPSSSAVQTSREVVTTALAELDAPSSPRQTADYARARFGVAVDHRAFAALRRDERRAFSSSRSHRPVYVVPALEGNRFLPMRGKLALSVWPLERRLLGPWSERVDHLRATMALAGHLRWLRETKVERTTGLLALLARYAASIAGTVADEEIDPSDVEDATRAELALLEPEDTAWRERAAELARAQLGEVEQLFGVKAPHLVKER